METAKPANGTCKIFSAANCPEMQKNALKINPKAPPKSSAPFKTIRAFLYCSLFTRNLTNAATASDNPYDAVPATTK